MKSSLVLLAISLVCIFSCKKENNQPINEDFGCINRFYPSPKDTLADIAKYNNALQLYTQFNIGNTNLKVLSVMYDTFNTDTYIDIANQQFVNTLPVFPDNIVYGFKNGTLNSTSGTIISKSSLDTISTLKITQVRALYVQQLTVPRSNNLYLPYKDSCLVAVFGYYNVNSGTSNPTISLVKAWYVYPKNNAVPYAYFADDGSLILFFTGIVY